MLAMHRGAGGSLADSQLHLQRTFAMKKSPVCGMGVGRVGQYLLGFSEPQGLRVQEGSSTGTRGLGRREVVRVDCLCVLEGNSFDSGGHASFPKQESFSFPLYPPSNKVLLV